MQGLRRKDDLTSRGLVKVLEDTFARSSKSGELGEEGADESFYSSTAMEWRRGCPHSGPSADSGADPSPAHGTEIGRWQGRTGSSSKADDGTING